MRFIQRVGSKRESLVKKTKSNIDFPSEWAVRLVISERLSKYNDCLSLVVDSYTAVKSVGALDEVRYQTEQSVQVDAR